MRKLLIIRFLLAILLIQLLAGFVVGYSNADDIIAKPAQLANADRTVNITALEYLFLPAEIHVAQGETIEFIVENKGNKKHEMAVGSWKNLKHLAKMRRNNPDSTGEHGRNQITLDPGETKKFAVAFTEVGTLYYACPLPGHFKGMRGMIHVETK